MIVRPPRVSVLQGFEIVAWWFDRIGRRHLIQQESFEPVLWEPAPEPEPWPGFRE